MGRLSNLSLRLALRLYALALHLFPAEFRREYGEELLRVVQDHLRATYQQRRAGHTIRVMAGEFADLVGTALLERQDARTKRRRSSKMQHTEQRLITARPSLAWPSLLTLLACMLAIFASMQLYLLEDGNALTDAAYASSALLHVSYVGAYLSALAVGVVGSAIVWSLLTSSRPVVLLLIGGESVVTLMGGFGGLLERHPGDFLLLGALFLSLVVCAMVIAHLVTTRAQRWSQPPLASIRGACAGALTGLGCNLALVIAHTLALNPVSHALYMQGQIGTSHLNSLLLAMCLEGLATALAVLAQWSTSRPHQGRGVA